MDFGPNHAPSRVWDADKQHQAPRSRLPPWPMLVSRWHLSLLCNGRGVSSLLASGPAAAAVAVAAGRPGSPAPAGAASAASPLAAAPPAACAYTPTQKRTQ